MSLTIIFSIIFIHWVSDFVLQTHWQSTNKSTNNGALLQHTILYSLIWWIPIFILMLINVGGEISLILPCYFVGITFIAHTITDYFTSRLNTYLWTKGDIHNFFVSVGFDQCCHYLQLFLTFYFLTK